MRPQPFECGRREKKDENMPKNAFKSCTFIVAYHTFTHIAIVSRRQAFQKKAMPNVEEKKKKEEAKNVSSHSKWEDSREYLSVVCLLRFESVFFLLRHVTQSERFETKIKCRI